MKYCLFRYLYWTDWGKNAAIERISMNGDLKTREKLISTDIVWPNGLTLDLIQKKMYWIDAKLDSIEVADFHGGNRQIIKKNGKDSFKQYFYI